MATSIKVTRPNRLSEEETLTTFEDWKNNLIFYLNQGKDFQLFLKHGRLRIVMSSLEICLHLEQFLGVITSTFIWGRYRGFDQTFRYIQTYQNLL